MSPKKAKRQSERRQHPRLPVVEGLIEPITLRLEDGKSPRNQPAILTNLSAGGMSLVMFAEPPHARKLEMVLSLPGIEIPVEAKVIRISEKGQTFNVGITFTKISKKHQSQISRLAQDFGDCETRLALHLPEACVPDCTFNKLCMKPQKAPHWPPKA